MENNIQFTSANNFKSGTDYAANRALGIPGSITGYIMTGNQYNNDYYVKSGSSDSKKSKSNTLPWLIGTATTIAALFLAKKTNKFPKLTSAIDKMTTPFKNTLTKIKSKASTINFSKFKFNFKPFTKNKP